MLVDLVALGVLLLLLLVVGGQGEQVAGVRGPVVTRKVGHLVYWKGVMLTMQSLVVVQVLPGPWR